MSHNYNTTMKKLKAVAALCLMILSLNSETKQFKTISSREGLSNNAILSMHQDNKGHLYLGTMDGLNIWNGNTIEIFSSADGKNIFFGNKIRHIIPGSDEKACSWEVLKDPAYKGKLLMKDAFRDIYTALLTALNKDALESGEKDLRTLAFDTSDESIALVEGYLNSFKESIAGWEADFGKEQMTKELAWMNLSWSGDAQWAIDEAAEMDIELRYTIPSEGSAVWFDGWVIPKYARNIKAASYFINFMCMPENALRNMDMTGYVSAIG